MHRVSQPERILKPFCRREEIREPIKRLKASLPSGAALWIVGGAPRNAIIEAFHGKSPLTGDIDVFIGDVDPGLQLSGLDLDGELRRTEIKTTTLCRGDHGT